MLGTVTPFMTTTGKNNFSWDKYICENGNHIEITDTPVFAESIFCEANDNSLKIYKNNQGFYFFVSFYKNIEIEIIESATSREKLFNRIDNLKDSCRSINRKLAKDESFIVMCIVNKWGVSILKYYPLFSFVKNMKDINTLLMAYNNITNHEGREIEYLSNETLNLYSDLELEILKVSLFSTHNKVISPFEEHRSIVSRLPALKENGLEEIGIDDDEIMEFFKNKKMNLWYFYSRFKKGKKDIAVYYTADEFDMCECFLEQEDELRLWKNFTDIVSEQYKYYIKIESNWEDGYG